MSKFRPDLDHFAGERDKIHKIQKLDKRIDLIQRVISALMVGAAFGACALLCRIVGLGPIAQAWAALTMVVMLNEVIKS